MWNFLLVAWAMFDLRRLQHGKKVGLQNTPISRTGKSGIRFASGGVVALG